MRACAACDAILREAASFCPECGAATDEQVRRERSRRTIRDRSERHALQAMCAVFVGSLISIVGAYYWAAEREISWSLELEVVYLGLLMPPTAFALWRLGTGSLRASLGGPAPSGWWLLGALVGPGVLGVGVLYVDGLSELVFGVEADFALELPVLTALLLIAVSPALVEETLFRGVMWEASRRVLTPGRTLLLTSLLFTFAHGLQGSYFAYPHRFVAGLVFGWLRMRTGSLIPGMCAHFTCNGTWVLMVD